MAGTGYRSLLVPYDFSQHAREALDTAIELAVALGGAVVHLLHVIRTPVYAYAGYVGYPGSTVPASLETVPPPLDMSDVRASAEKSLDEVREVIKGLDESSKVPIETHVLEHTVIDRAICQMAEQLDADLIVMGTHGRTGLAHVFLGSVAERTLRRAPCPVLTVHSADEDAEEAAEDG